MKRALKIIGWTVLGLVLTVVAVVCIAVYIVFTPERLTPIARQAASKYITCEYEIGEVDLTFLSTFPRFGFRAKDLLLVNPKSGAQNDTVVEAKLLTATVDVAEFWNHKNLHVYEAVLEDAKVNFFIAPDGTNNLTEVFVTAPDTAAEDTSAFALPFDGLRVDGLRLKTQSITFVDRKDTVEASLGATELKAAADDWNNMLLLLEANDVCARLKEETYADRLHVELLSSMAVDLNTMHFAFESLSLAVNEFQLDLAGEVTVGDVIDLDATLKTNTWDIQSLLAIVPKSITQSMDEYRLRGNIELDAAVKGQYSDTQMPDVTINMLKAQVWNSKLAAKGTIDDIANDMRLDLKTSLNANIPDFKAFLPKDMHLTGHVKGKANARIRLSDLKEMNLHKGKIDANLTLTQIHYAKDSMVAYLPRTQAQILIPNSKPSKPKANWVKLDLETEHVDFSMATPLAVTLDKSTIRLESGNILSDDPVLYAAVGLQTNAPMIIEMDSMGGTIVAPQIAAYAEYNTKDTTVMPVLQAAIDCQALDGFYQDIVAQLKASHLEASLSGRRSDKTAPRVRATLKTTALKARQGETVKAETGALNIEASARYNKEGSNFLLQWNPRLIVDLKEGELDLPERLHDPIIIPSIEFDYSNREMNIDNSRVELGNSDLNLKGQVRYIGEWFRHEHNLEAELDVVSNHTDANQLMDWFSADAGSEENPAEVAQQQAEVVKDSTPETEPFLVPTDVNLALNTHIQEVEIFNQLAKDLRGGIYLNDGTLILDEVGFVCRAAKLQLTAMYRTPRRNHIYAGIDYHMLDVDIDELMSMIPNLEQMVPMLSSFKGAAQFHLAVETYLNSQYQPKMSTLRGAASLTGKDLVVLDGETFDKISKLLLFNKKTENKIDSINAEMTIYKNEIDIYPLCVNMDNYMVALGGRHNTNMTFDYDINVLSPIYLGVNVSGNMDDLQIKLAKCKFAQDFKPHWYQKADTQSREIRERIKQSMEKNVRIK